MNTEEKEKAPETEERRSTKSSRSLADLERLIGHYPESIRNDTAWLQGFWMDYCKGNIQTLRGVSAKLNMEMSDSWFWNLLNGYNFVNEAGSWKEGGTAWRKFTLLMDAIRKFAHQASVTGKMPFVATPSYECLASFVDGKRAVAAVCKFGGVVGPTGAQKSASFKQYRLLNNHGAVIHIEAPANGKLGALQRKIAEAYHVNRSNILTRREEAILEQLNESRCIIIDNAQRLYLQNKGADQPAFNWLLDVQDSTGCTIILSFTTDFVDVLTAGRAKGYFEQFIGRFGGDDALLRLPDYAPPSDLRSIAKAFGLLAVKGAMDLLRKWSHRPGRIRIVFEKIQLAQRFAKLAERDKINAEDLAEADAYAPQAFSTEEGED